MKIFARATKFAITKNNIHGLTFFTQIWYKKIKKIVSMLQLFYKNFVVIEKIEKNIIKLFKQVTRTEDSAEKATSN